MKKLLFVLSTVFLLSFSACSDEEDIENDNYIYLDVSISDKQLYYDLYIYGTNTTIDWGDGIVEDFELSTSSTAFKEPRHYYEKEGVYRVKIKTDNIIYAYFYRATHNDSESFTQNILLGKCPLLESISFSMFENIQTLDLKNCPQLKTVLIQYLPSLSSLNISNNQHLETLYLKFNPNLLYLDISKNIKLSKLSCLRNGLSSIKMNNNENLNDVILSYNQFESSELNNIFISLPIAGNKNSIIIVDNNPGTENCNKKIIKDKGWEIL